MQDFKTKRKKVSLSVVIPSYKPGEDIFRCLGSVMDQSIDIPYEVIVVDSSPLNPEERIHNQFPRVQVYHLESRTLSGRARSHGARMASGDIVFFTDTDCVADRDWIRELHAVLEAGYGVAGGSVVNGTPDSAVGTAEYLLEFNETNPWIRSGEVRALPSCNLAVRKHIFERVGYFPDFMKGEDTIFCENVIASGERIFFTPGARIYHRNRTRFVRFVRNQVSLGEGALESRRRTSRPGRFLIRAPFLIPLIPVFRTLMIGKRFLFSSRRLFRAYLLHYPLIAIGILAHTWGFIRGPYRDGFSTENVKEYQSA